MSPHDLCTCGNPDCAVEHHTAAANHLDEIDRREGLTPEQDLQLWLSWNAERIARAHCEGTNRHIDLDLSTGRTRAEKRHSAPWRLALWLIQLGKGRKAA